MNIGSRKTTALLLCGDLVVFALSLWLTVVLRYAAIPSAHDLEPYTIPFAVLFLTWMLIFAMSGLYGKRVALFRSEVPRAILRTQLFNITVAALFFFFVPIFGIAPKTTLLIYLAVSLCLIYLWRLAMFPRITMPGEREAAALVGEGPEVEELVKEVNGTPRYRLRFRLVINSASVVSDVHEFEAQLAQEKITLLVVDAAHQELGGVLGRIYDRAFLKQEYQFADFSKVYEDVFDRVPLSLLRSEWFLQNIFPRTGFGFYEITKRVIDIVGGIIMAVITVIITPFIFVAMQFEGGGDLFISQERIGKGGSSMRAYKFRSMRFNNAASATWVGEEHASKENQVTRLGKFLRRTSLDEFPQFLNILRGELSLIGPRNDIAGLGLRLAEAIPYYQARYIVKPGITGWAQINQRYEPGNISPQSIEETKVRLAYDFYYIKNRSFALELLIVLRTFKRMLFRVSTI